MNKLKILSLFLLQFSLNCLAVTYHGAGVLPYAYSQRNNKTYFLFSREHFGKNKGEWADFGGGKERFDHNNPILTGSREFFEESCEIFGPRSKYNQSVANSSRNKHLHGGNGYIMYLVKVGFRYDINKTFLRKRAGFWKFSKIEKDKLTWVSAAELDKAIRNNNKFVKDIDGHIIELRGSTLKTLKDSFHNFIKRHL